jgi:hypothetical protein
MRRNEHRFVQYFDTLRGEWTQRDPLPLRFTERPDTRRARGTRTPNPGFLLWRLSDDGPGSMPACQPAHPAHVVDVEVLLPVDHDDPASPS